MDEEYECPPDYNNEVEHDYNENKSTENNTSKQIALYSFEGIMDYLQSEWSKMDLVRSQWSNEKVEFQMKIGYLQNEVKLQENLKRDLVRRIKMLEYALKQERLKTSHLASGTSVKEEAFLKNLDYFHDQSPNRNAHYSDTILAKVRPQNNFDKKTNPIPDTSVADKEVYDAISELDMLVSNHLDDEFLEEDNKSNLSEDKLVIDKYKELYRLDCNRTAHSKDRSKSVNSWLKKENDLIERIAESTNVKDGFLINDTLDINENKKVADKNGHDNENVCSKNQNLGELADLSLKTGEDYSTFNEVNSRQNLSPPPKIDELDRVVGFYNKSLVTAKNQSTVFSRGLSASSASSCESIQSVIPLDPPLSWAVKYSLRSHFDGVRSVSFHPTESLVISSSEDASVKVWNLNKTVSTKKSKNLDVEPIYSFRGHMKPVLSHAIITLENSFNIPRLISPTNEAKNSSSNSEEKAIQNDEPTEDLSSNHIVISGDLNGVLHTWCLPDTIGEYEPFEPYNSHLKGPAYCLSDAIWSIKHLQSANIIACCTSSSELVMFSRDAVVEWLVSHSKNEKLDPSFSQRILLKDLCPKIIGRPTVIHPITSSSASIGVGFTSGELAQIDITTGKLIRTYKSYSDSDYSKTTFTPEIINCIAPINKTGTQFVTGHDDKNLRFWDIQQPNPIITSMLAHTDAVSGVTTHDTSPSQICTSSHDSSVRIWLTETRSCLQEITCHRNKFDEAIHDVSFHPKKMMLATAGADSLVRVFIRGHSDQHLNNND